jgi:AcrR family transcriptional regulator
LYSIIRVKRTRELVIETATALSYEKGFAGSSVRDVVKAAGVAN